MVGRSKTVNEDDIYQCMLDIHDLSKKITINKLALSLGCSTRTIHRNMSNELKKEKELLNREL
jgi:transcriptional antiterminator